MITAKRQYVCGGQTFSAELVAFGDSTHGMVEKELREYVCEKDGWKIRKTLTYVGGSGIVQCITAPVAPPVAATALAAGDALCALDGIEIQ